MSVISLRRNYFLCNIHPPLWSIKLSQIVYPISDQFIKKSYIIISHFETNIFFKFVVPFTKFTNS